MRRSAAVVLALLAGCSSAKPVPRTTQPPLVLPAPPTPGEPSLPGLQVVDPAAPEASRFGTVTLATGFTPDPTVVQGRAGGSIDASRLGSGCVGWVDPGLPNHVLMASTGYDRLRILARSMQDITLVVQGPSGQYLCNDDTEGTNPALDLPGASEGVYRIWVGTYAAGPVTDYVLGFSENAATSCATLPQPTAPMPVPTPTPVPVPTPTPVPVPPAPVVVPLPGPGPMPAS